MNHRIQIFAVFGSLAITALIFELIRKRKMLEKYSLLWFSSAVILFVLALWRDLLERAAAFLGVFYAPSALFIIAAFCAMAMFLHFTVVISKLTEQNKTLAQELGIMREELRRIRPGAQSEAAKAN